MTLDLHTFRLRNGLRVVMHRDAQAPLVCVNLAYDVGSRDEVPGEFGYAHLLEHLMFNGSAHVPRGAFDAWCEGVGGYNNAFTSEDKTNYYMVLPSSHLELGLWLESDRLFGLEITEDGFRAQQSVVLEEKRQRIDNQPYGQVEEAVATALFAGQAYGHTVIGTEADLEHATRDRLYAFYRRHYRPENAVLVLTGDLDPQDAEIKVRRWFEEEMEPSAPRTLPPAAPQAVKACTEMYDAVPLEGVFVAWRICSEQDPDFLALDLATDILGSGESSRLIRRLLYDTTLASQANAYVEARKDPGQLMVYAIANPGHDAAELEAVILEEVERLAERGPTPEEIERVRNRVAATFYLSMTTMAARAEKLAHFALVDDDPQRIERIVDEYLAVSATDIQASVRTWLRRDTAARIFVLPDPDQQERGRANPDEEEEGRES